jgi:multiple sugar transport system substrate-binding protein
MSSQEKRDQSRATGISRRRYLELTAAAAAGLVVGGAAGYLAAPKPAPPTPIDMPMPTWQYGEEPFATFWKESFQMYMKTNPGINLYMVSVPYADYQTKLTIDLASGTAADLVKDFTFTGDFYHHVQMDALEPLDRWIAGTDYEKWVSENAVKLNGHYYGLTAWVSPWAVMYRKDMFDAAGLKVPTTPDEFYAAAKELTKPELQQYGFGFDTIIGDLWEQVLVMIIGMTGKHLTTQDGTPQVNDPDIVDAVTYAKKFFDEKITPTGIDDYKIRDLVGAGKIAMKLDGPWAFGTIQTDYPDAYPKMGSFNFPGPKAPYGFPNLSVCYSIAKNAKHKEEAWGFWEFINSEERQQRFVNMECGYACRPGAITDQFLAANPYFAAYQEQAQKGLPWTMLPLGQEINGSALTTMFQTYLEEIMLKGSDPKTALDQCQKDFEDYIAKHPTTTTTTTA